MKNRILKTFVLIAGAPIALLSSCQVTCLTGSGHQASENRKVEDFKNIDVSGAFKVILVQDSTLSVNITADDNLLKEIETSVSGDRLSIGTKETNLCNTGEMIVIIGVRNIKEIKSSGAVEITSNGKINAGDIDFDLSGATQINMELNAARVTTNSSGSTKINLKGQASTHNVNLSGSSNINAPDFIVSDYNISSSGSSDCLINVLHNLDVHSSGSSSIKYRGTPVKINNDKSGSSSITKVD